jgi:hypothetical protein
MVRLPWMFLVFHVHLIDCLDVDYDGHHDQESVVVCAHVGQNPFHYLVVSGRLYLYGRERSGVYEVDVKVSDFYLVAFLLSVFGWIQDHRFIIERRTFDNFIS